MLTCARCTEVQAWQTVPTDEIKEKNPNGIFDGQDPSHRRPVLLEELPLLDENGRENVVYNFAGRRIQRRRAMVDINMPPCGVLVQLSNIHALFDPYTFGEHTEESSTTSTDVEDYQGVHVDAYPLGFLKEIGNIQADGIPACFYPLVTKINRSVRKRSPVYRPRSGLDRGLREEEEVVVEVEEEEEEEEDYWTGDGDEPNRKPSLPAVKGVSAQFYNYVTHRVATRAGRHDAQQGTVTAAISGGFANCRKHKRIALERQSYCDQCLPSDRFHNKISIEDCPTSCRVELVYSVDVRALKNPSGRYIRFTLLTVSSYL